MAEALVRFGGNIGDVRETIKRAIALFGDGRQVRLTARPADYRTPPWRVPSQPPFVNAVVAAKTELAPPRLSDPPPTV